MAKVKSKFGSILSEWRSIRHASQLDLAVATGVSQRHISFVESGRAQPSRELIMKLAVGLDLSLRSRNELFLAAGYAPAYRERTLDLAEMEPVRDALDRILSHQEPYPSIATDAAWDIVMQNAAASRIIALGATNHSTAQPPRGSRINLMRLMFSADGLRSNILNWSQIGPMLLNRLRREAVSNPGSPSAKLLREFSEDSVLGGRVFAPDEQLDPVLPLELLIGNVRLRLFTMFTTFGTPQDIGLQELRIDMSFPADELTRRFLTVAAESGIPRALKDVKAAENRLT
ncbi:MAG: helix-turn-helix transcriptional regulator [Terracidiphilus sp.]